MTTESYTEADEINTSSMQDLKASFNKAAELTDQISDRMSEAADGFQSMTETGNPVRETRSSNVSPSANSAPGHAVADD
jgi:methyl-accepting chemotaxis protein